MQSNLEADGESDACLRSDSSSDSPSSSTSATRLLRGQSICQTPGSAGSSGRTSEERSKILRYSNNRPAPSSNRRVVERQNSRNFSTKAPSPIVGLRATALRPASLGNSPIELKRNTQEHVSNEVFLPQSASSGRPGYRVSVTSIPDAHRILSRSDSRHSRTSSVGGVSYISRSSSVSDVMHNIPLREGNLAEEALNAPRISGRTSRTSGRQSIGQEWTRHHWDKIRDLEEESERARRCSKLSSGFAPLMVFGGLVFVCIGISANTNTGKDKERLKQLSAAPMAMGIFMLALGCLLIATWFGCRSRAKQLDRKLLHGSRRNSLDGNENVVDAILAKLHSHVGNIVTVRAGNRPETPTLPGVTLDGVVEHKESNSNASSSNNGSDARVLRETSV